MDDERDGTSTAGGGRVDAGMWQQLVQRVQQGGADAGTWQCGLRTTPE
jgi:hypothetical protein